jgi:hypothetical protein
LFTINWIVSIAAYIYLLISDKVFEANFGGLFSQRGKQVSLGAKRPMATKVDVAGTGQSCGFEKNDLEPGLPDGLFSNQKSQFW